MIFWTIIIYSTIFFGLYSSIFLLLTFFENKHNLENPKIKKFYDVAIVVPAYNEESCIGKTIESLLKLDYPKDKLKIIVVDDGSKDNTYEIAKRYESENVLVFTKPNGGKASSLNFVLKKINTDLVGCLDADSYVERSSLKKMIGFFEDENVMVVTPSIKVGKARNLLQHIQRIEYLMGVYLRKVFAFLGSIHVTPGPFSIYRKFFLDKYGGWDETTMTEDIELALRIQSKNYVLENSIDASVYTISPKTFRDLFKQRMRWYVGFIDNVINYKFLFSRKYGNLGIFILPSSFIFVGFSIMSLFYFVYRMIREVFEWNINLGVTNFEFLPAFRVMMKEFSYFSIHSFLIFTIVMMIFGVTAVYFGKKYSKETKSIGFFYVVFVLIYWMLFAFWWLIATIYKLFSVNIRWGGANGKTGS